MAKALVVYDSRTGNTEKMAQAIGDGLREAGLDAEVKKVKEATLADLVAAEAIVLGSPTYFGNMSGEMKTFIDKSIKIYPDKLQNKIGAAFTSSGGEGDYTALLSLIVAMFFHQMIIVGHQSGKPGAISIGTPDEKCIKECKVFGKRIASFAKGKRTVTKS